MAYTKTHYFSVFVPSVLLGFIAALQLTGCSDPAGLPSASAGAGGEVAQAGSSQHAGGAANQAGEAGASSETGDAGEGGTGPGNAEGGSTASGGAETGGSSSGGTIENGAGASTGGTAGVVASGGDSGGSPSASGGQGGTLNEAVIPATCPYHSDPPVELGGTGGTLEVGGAGGGGTGGSAGAAGAALTVTLQTSPFVGTYLADATGRTLYTYGNDLPGDCHTAPVSNCITDCLISWPIFPAGARILASGLDDAAFGAIHRDDGTWQTTYYGWPLYYYKTDLLLGQVAGQGKAKTWHIVEKKLPAVFIMKPGTTRYLADSSGHTLYVSANDQAGTAITPPVSNCTGTCLETFEPFHAQNFSVVTSLLIADFGSFVQPGKGTLQVAYKGKPLYRAITDLKSGDTNGTAVTGFTAALP